MADQISSSFSQLMQENNTQNDKSAAALSLLTTIAQSPTTSQPYLEYGKFLLDSENNATPLLVARQALVAFVLVLLGGSGVDSSFIRPYTAAGRDQDEAEGSTSVTSLELNEEEQKWWSLGETAFKGSNESVRREVVEPLVTQSRSGGRTGEDQLIPLHYVLSHMQELDEDWVAAANTLANIPLESGGRTISDRHKLSVYTKIVRLFLEAEESGMAQTYFSRASLLIHLTKDKPTLLTYRLSQARLFDYSRRFNEAASKYHELSFVTDIDEDERMFMLSAAVTCAILAPAGPQRSRILANLYRDDRHPQLPTYTASILRKMFLDQIIRPTEVKEFEKGLAEHQLAKIAVDRRLVAVEGEGEVGRKGPENVLDRAVMEHNVLACAKVYDNIRFEGLGSLLDLTPSAAEAMARTMIIQGRLRAWIDQVSHLIHFEGQSSAQQEDVTGTHAALGIEAVVKPIQGISLTDRWDERIKGTAMKVEEIVGMIENQGLLNRIPTPMAVD